MVRLSMIAGAAADRADEHSSLERCMALYGDTVLQTAYFILRDRQRAEDVFQEVFLRVYKHGIHLGGMSSTKAWIIKVTMNCCKDMMRTPWWRRVLLLGNSETWGDNSADQAIAAPSVEDYALLSERNREIYDSVLSLAEPYQSVVLLYYYHELSTPDIGKVLGISEGTVRSRLHRARAMLKLYWGKEEDNDSAGSSEESV